ncbi:hypothetical protein HNY73_023241 [Argiope bruennichi]|uniref:Uncharacterized protein n=1 Tax=Argiope bruennichi TaxID=94029 RepID=A0A8T0E762_ARGBR|nr:hypothetical protein HNY73_023241 [Argiope bruennichi]
MSVSNAFGQFLSRPGAFLNAGQCRSLAPPLPMPSQHPQHRRIPLSLRNSITESSSCTRIQSSGVAECQPECCPIRCSGSPPPPQHPPPEVKRQPVARAALPASKCLFIRTKESLCFPSASSRGFLQCLLLGQFPSALGNLGYQVGLQSSLILSVAANDPRPREALSQAVSFSRRRSHSSAYASAASVDPLQLRNQHPESGQAAPRHSVERPSQSAAVLARSRDQSSSHPPPPHPPRKRSQQPSQYASSDCAQEVASSFAQASSASLQPQALFLQCLLLGPTNSLSAHRKT